MFFCCFFPSFTLIVQPLSAYSLVYLHLSLLETALHLVLTSINIVVFHVQCSNNYYLPSPSLLADSMESTGATAGNESGHK